MRRFPIDYSLILAATRVADPDCVYDYHGIEGISGRYYIAPIA